MLRFCCWCYGMSDFFYFLNDPTQNKRYNTSVIVLIIILVEHETLKIKIFLTFSEFQIIFTKLFENNYNLIISILTINFQFSIFNFTSAKLFEQ